MNFSLGDVVQYSQAYPRRCTWRFRADSGRLVKDALPYPDSGGQGIVVGMRHVFMSNYQYHGAKGGNYDSSSEYDVDAPYASGTVEKVLLVTKSIYKEPFIVRLCDVLAPKPNDDWAYSTGDVY